MYFYIALPSNPVSDSCHRSNTVNFAISVGVAVLRRSSLRGTSSRGRSCVFLLLLLLGSLTGTAGTRDRNDTGVNIQSKELQSVGVVRRPGVVGLGQFDGAGVPVSVVVESTVADAWNVGEAVKDITGEQPVGALRRDGVSKGAEFVVRMFDLIGEGADDGFLRGVVSAPVACPSVHVAVSIDVVASEKHALLVFVGDALVRTDDSIRRSGSEVRLVHIVVRTVLKNVIAGSGHQLVGFSKRLSQLAHLRGIARVVDLHSYKGVAAVEGFSCAVGPAGERAGSSGSGEQEDGKEHGESCGNIRS